MWDQLEASGVTDITGVWGHCRGLMVVIALRQRYAGHAKQALLTANSYRVGGSMFRYYVTVDDDIDPSNIKDVLWALCTRVDPAASVDIVRGAWTADLDPRLSPVRSVRGPHDESHVNRCLQAILMAGGIPSDQRVLAGGACNRYATLGGDPRRPLQPTARPVAIANYQLRGRKRGSSG